MLMRVCACTLVIELLFVQAILPEEDAKMKMKFLKNFFSFSIFKVWRIRNDVAVDNNNGNKKCKN